MSYIEIKNYSKSIKGQQILKNVNIEMEKGYVYGLYGSNGSGKTMLLRSICGLIKADRGYVRVGNEIVGKDVSFPSSVGVLIESPGFWERYTGFENLQVLASIKNKIGDEEIIRALKRVGLDPDDKRTYKKYSLGMKQRLGIAQAIMENPDLLLLDEPTNALDEDGINRVRNIILEEKKRGATLIMANHNKDDMEMLADKVFIVSSGNITIGEFK